MQKPPDYKEIISCSTPVALHHLTATLCRRLYFSRRHRGNSSSAVPSLSQLRLVRLSPICFEPQEGRQGLPPPSHLLFILFLHFVLFFFFISTLAPHCCSEIHSLKICCITHAVEFTELYKAASLCVLGGEILAAVFQGRRAELVRLSQHQVSRHSENK